jgi:hypothetical protein
MGQMAASRNPSFADLHLSVQEAPGSDRHKEAQKRVLMASRELDAQTLDLLENLHSADNLVQVVLHAHLIVERALAIQVAKKFERPGVITGKDARWTFSELVSLYIGLYNPPLEQVQSLRGLNKLRNSIAHQLHTDEEIASAYLPWFGEQYPDPPPLLVHVRTIALSLLLDLEVIDSICQRDWLLELRESVMADPRFKAAVDQHPELFEERAFFAWSRQVNQLWAAELIPFIEELEKSKE